MAIVFDYEMCVGKWRKETLSLGVSLRYLPVKQQEAMAKRGWGGVAR